MHISPLFAPSRRTADSDTRSNPRETPASSTTQSATKMPSFSAPQQITAGILGLPMELLYEIAYHIKDTNTLSKFIRTHSHIAMNITQQLYRRALKLDDRAPITGKCVGKFRMMHWAVQHNDDKLLLCIVDVYGVDLEWALWSNEKYNAQIEGRPLRKPVSVNPVHYAAGRGNVKICDIFLSKAPHVFKIDHLDKRGDTPLHFAARSRNPIEITAYLKKKGADLEAINHWGRRPLHVAIESVNPLAVSLLLQEGVNPNTRITVRSQHPACNPKFSEEVGHSPLGLACQRNINHQNLLIVQLLLVAGADPTTNPLGEALKESNPIARLARELVVTLQSCPRLTAVYYPTVGVACPASQEILRRLEKVLSWGKYDPHIAKDVLEIEHQNHLQNYKERMRIPHDREPDWKYHQEKRAYNEAKRQIQFALKKWIKPEPSSTMWTLKKFFQGMFKAHEVNPVHVTDLLRDQDVRNLRDEEDRPNRHDKRCGAAVRRSQNYHST